MAQGLIYFARNPAFQHLTKIGKTSKLNVEERGLTASNVPEDFDYIAVFKCEDMDWAECKIHEQFKTFRHVAAGGRKTEFFWSGCIADAIKYTKDLKGVYDATEDETEEIEVQQNGENQRTRIPNTTFEMLGLAPGTVILFKNDPNMPAVIVDGRNKIKYGDWEPRSISAVANELLNSHVNGFEYFYYNNEMLFLMRPDMRPEKDECQIA